MNFLNKIPNHWKTLLSKISRIPDASDTHSTSTIFKSRTKQPNFMLSILVTTMKLFFILMIIVGVTGTGAVLGVAKAYVETTPSLDVEKIEEQDQTSFIYDVNGVLITEFSGVENRVWAPIDTIPQNLQNAFIAIEDVRFQSHQGLDIKRLFGALVNNLRNEDVQGGSTLTQQIIKQRILTSERTYKRKIQEAYLAIQLEQRYSKSQILEAYLNTIHLGGSNYGVKAAAKDYFGKELDKLSIKECATLAGITKNPYQYNPRKNYYDRNKPEDTDDRTNIVLYVMYENGFITKEQYDLAKSEKLVVLKESEHLKLYDMAYFVEYAIYDVVTQMLKNKKIEDNPQNRRQVERDLRTGGYHIYTTVDPEIQKIVETSFENWKRYPPLQRSKDKIVTVNNADGSSTEIPQPQAAAAVFDYHSGQLKAVVGGRFTPTQKKQLNRAYQANMPVGSSIKPLAVYGPAIDKGASPATIVYNIPVKIDGWGTSKGYPDNYGGGGFSGPVDLRHGLIKSLNVVAARTLYEYVGLEDSFNYLVSLGINPNHVNKDGPGLSLGTSGITPIEMAVAFGAIGNKGVYQEPISFTKVVDSNNQVILDMEKTQIKRQVFKPSTAWLLVDMMRDAVTQGTGSRAQIKGMTVVGKTGTNSDYKGVFFSGITPYYSAAVWVGHDRYKSLYRGAQGGKDAAPLWQDFMSKIHKDLKNQPIIPESPKDLGLQKVSICSVSGDLATPLCNDDVGGHKVINDWFLKGTVPKEKCKMHQQAVSCKESNKLVGPYCPEELKQNKGIIVIPEKSPLRGLSDAQLTKYVPGAVKSLPDMDLTKIDPSDPKYAQLFCTIHTKEWKDQEQTKNQLAQKLLQTSNAIKEKIKQFPEKFSPEQVAEWNNAIDTANRSIQNNDLASMQNNLAKLEGILNQISK